MVSGLLSGIGLQFLLLYLPIYHSFRLFKDLKLCQNFPMPGKRRTQPPRPPAGPPATAEEGAARVRALLVKAFDRKDGTGADWCLMLESLYRAGFGIADEQLEGIASVVI